MLIFEERLNRKWPLAAFQVLYELQSDVWPRIMTGIVHVHGSTSFIRSKYSDGSHGSCISNCLKFPSRTFFEGVNMWKLMLGLVVIGLLSCLVIADQKPEKGEEWTNDFSMDKDPLTSTGRNPYFILEPGYQLVFEDDDERVVKTVLDETKLIDGVECRVIAERETKNGKIVETSRNYFAISKRTNSVYYFGEDVDDYKDDKIVGHSGSWLAGKDGARFGLMMPGVPLLKGRFYQEVAPNVAEDRAEIIGLGVSIKTPAGEFTNCVKMEETTPLEPGTKEQKIYAPGIGCVQDGDLKLVKYGKVELPVK